jgi:transcriptional regulator with XRE-family HTH domain
MPPAPTATSTADAGPTFRSARVGTGLTIRRLAQRAEVDYSTISRWERGERAISATTYEHLSAALADYMAGRWAA